MCLDLEKNGLNDDYSKSYSKVIDKNSLCNRITLMECTTSMQKKRRLPGQEHKFVRSHIKWRRQRVSRKKLCLKGGGL